MNNRFRPLTRINFEGKIHYFKVMCSNRCRIILISCLKKNEKENYIVIDNQIYKQLNVCVNKSHDALRTPRSHMAEQATVKRKPLSQSRVVLYGKYRLIQR